MGVINTTGVIDSSIFLKAELPPNMVGDNYYIENLQDKRNAEWEYRYNRVEIEEELSKQVDYSKTPPAYTPIDAVINTVKGDKGVALGTDWASLSFRELRHPNGIGSRYRFSLNFPDMRNMTEEEKHYQTSIWICTNKDPINAGNSCVIRRCNSTLVLLGYENRDRRNISTREIHLEPVILENQQMRYMQVYYNQTLPVPQAEWYAVTQLNYYTNNIKINDRFIFGTVDTEVEENNSVYKVKALIKSNNGTTFVKIDEKGDSDELLNTPLLIMALDRDIISPQDNFKTRIANNAPVYLLPTSTGQEEDDIPTQPIDEGDDITPVLENYVLQDKYVTPTTIPLGSSRTYEFDLLYNGEAQQDFTLSYDYQLIKKKQEEWSNYFRFDILDDRAGFTVTNLKTWLGGDLEVTINCYIPDIDQTITKVVNLTLGKSY